MWLSSRLGLEESGRPVSPVWQRGDLAVFAPQLAVSCSAAGPSTQSPGRDGCPARPVYKAEDPERGGMRDAGAPVCPQGLQSRDYGDRNTHLRVTVAFPSVLLGREGEGH